MAYGQDIREEAKRLVVLDGYTPGQASDHLGGAPAASTIDAWARTEENERGESWYAERERLATERYRVAAPQHQAHLLMRKIGEVLAEPGFDARRGDMLSKLQGFLKAFVDSDYHLAMTFQALGTFTRFLREHYPGLLDGTDYVQALRDFKQSERSKIEGH